MTLVTRAVYSAGAAIIAADLLMTSEDLRSRGRTINPQPSDKAGVRCIAGLNQKIVNINPNLMIGASGDKEDIRRIIRHLRASVGQRTITLQELGNIVSKSAVDAFQRVQFECIGLSDNQLYHCGWRDALLSQDPEVRVC